MQAGSGRSGARRRRARRCAITKRFCGIGQRALRSRRKGFATVATLARRGALLCEAVHTRPRWRRTITNGHTAAGKVGATSTVFGACGHSARANAARENIWRWAGACSAGPQSSTSRRGVGITGESSRHSALFVRAEPNLVHPNLPADGLSRGMERDERHQLTGHGGKIGGVRRKDCGWPLKKSRRLSTSTAGVGRGRNFPKRSTKRAPRLALALSDVA